MGRGLDLAELNQLGLELWLNWCLEDFPGGVVGWWGWGKAGNKAKAQLQLGLQAAQLSLAIKDLP